MAAHADFEAFTCACRVAVAEPSALPAALAGVQALLRRVDEAASSFRADSELALLQRAGGGTASPLLAHLVRAALDVAERSGGDVVPTLGRELATLGFGTLDPGALPAAGPRPAESWREITLEGNELSVPRGVVLDLGATAKAAAADLAAHQVHDEIGTSVLVSLGGDIATAGRAAWEVLVQDLPGDPATQVSLGGGWAMATSSIQKRRRGAGVHHILDPWTALPAPAAWRSVTVAAPDCLSANMASTAAIVRGTGAVARLRELGLPARLVRHDGGVIELGGWPAPRRDIDAVPVAGVRG
ncbi:FAD:protein FMN transferase [Sinomonas atrocyanea]|uniref:FAD:protein FMN transferase n=1 Tax=Sinomonas atrocyanea TaxID=37927 RepID=UPI0028645524|nr:FAD:protein FMN transferase [Sinomonas atrocyanea]MDR6621741.1 thiamine biosynthesis lipoprotein [Sinomonas atrocyanea]